jgi:hypothetical protein
MQSFFERNLIIRDMASIRLDTSEQKGLILGRQEGAVFRKWRDDGQVNYANDYSDAAFDDENPCDGSQLFA